MDAIFQPLATATNASVDQIKLIFCLLVAYPLGSVYVRIPPTQPALRHLFNILVAVLFFFPVLRLYSAFFQLLGSIMATYLVAKYDTSWRMPWIVFVIVMGHLTVNHVIRAVYGFSYETMEVTGPQMVLTMKLTTFAWNVYDGRRPAADLDKWQLSKRLPTYPSLLAFLGYAFYFPGILVGPYLDFTEYLDVTAGTPFLRDPALAQGEHRQKLMTSAGGRMPAGRKTAAYARMGRGLAWLGAFVVLGGTYNYAAAMQPWFTSMPLWKRLVVFQFFGPLERGKYYAIWTLTEGASILTGLGYTGLSPTTHRPTWNGAANVRVWEIEFPPNFKVLLDSWNMKTNVWLRECVYKRVTPKGKKPGFRSSMITFFTSAFWHGIASGYYLTFLMGGFITTAARLARANFRPFFLPPQPSSNPQGLAIPDPNPTRVLAKYIYDLCGILLSMTVLNYSASPFIILSARDSFKVWGILAYYGHIIVLGSLVFFYAGGTRWLKGMQKKWGVLPPPRVAKPDERKIREPASGTATPVQEKNFLVPPGLDAVVKPE